MTAGPITIVAAAISNCHFDVYLPVKNVRPEYWLRNLNQIYSKALNPALDLVWTGKASAKEAMDQAAADAKPLMAGRWN